MTMQARTTEAGWVDASVRNPQKAGEYLVEIRYDGKIMKDRLEWSRGDWRMHNGAPTNAVVNWYDEDAADGEYGTLTEAGQTDAADPARLAMYEERIRLYKEQIGTGYIGIGRTLNEAKAAGVVPHGQWEDWVTRTTGLNPRQAQRCMQAATEIRDGSALAQLEMSKALMLLSSGLDSETREEVAEKAAGRGATVRELRAEIARIRAAKEREDAENAETVKALKLQVVKESGTAAEIREALKKAQSERDQMEQQMRARESGWQARMDAEVGKAYQRGLSEQAVSIEKETRKEFQEKLDFLNGKAMRAEDALRDAREDLKKAQDALGSKWDEGYKAREQEIREKEALIETLTEQARKAHTDAAELEDLHRDAIQAKNREIDELQEELEAAEAREAKRAAELAALKKEKAQAGMDAARGIGAQAVGAMDLTAAVRDFIGRAGVLPQMGNLIAGMSAEEREQIRVQVETVAEWVRSARTAMGTVVADATIR